MESQQTKCFYCYKALNPSDEKYWLENDGTCPNCATPFTSEDESCWNCDKPTIQEDQILYCLNCFTLVSEMSED